jgi:predicted GNAT superfamily acetyltransferase
MSTVLRSPSADDDAAMLALNNEFAVETSLLDIASLRQLVASSFYIRIAGQMDGFCIALDQEAGYQNPNFEWFRRKYRRFIYIDRVVVAAHARGRGIARKIYGDLKLASQNADHSVIGCEINIDPPNPASDRFHEAFGFVEVGRAFVADRAKTVRYLALSI